MNPSLRAVTLSTSMAMVAKIPIKTPLKVKMDRPHNEHHASNSSIVMSAPAITVCGT